MRMRLFTALVVLLLAASLGSGAAFADQSKQAWVQVLEATDLWSGPNDDAVSFGTVAQWDYLRVEGSAGKRLYVFNPRSKGTAFIDADKVGPSGAPPKDYLKPPKPAPKPQPAAQPAAGQPAAGQPEAPTFTPWWVQPFEPTDLWSGAGADATTQGQIGAWNYLQVIAPQDGSRLHVRDPLTGGTAYVDATAVGPAGAPADGDLVPHGWLGYVGSDSANIRSEPRTNAPIVGEVPHGATVAVQAWVAGDEVYPDQPGWAKLDDGAYIYGPLLRRVDLKAPPSPPQGGAPYDGRWIDVNLTLQEVTAFEGDTPVYWAATSSGPGWETPAGTYAIQRRVENETMESNTLLGQDAARADYKVENVKFTQYFSADGMALHANYWRDPALFGIPSSHGCLGMPTQDAEWFWNWADVGTPVVVHP